MKKITYISILVCLTIASFTACDLFGGGKGGGGKYNREITASFYDCADGNVVKIVDVKIPKSTQLYANSKAIPAKAGYTVKDSKWYTDPSCTAVYTFGQVLNEDIRLYTIFAPNKYTVKFDANTSVHIGTLPETTTCNYDEEYIISFTDFSYPNHVFQAWNTDKNGNGTDVAKNGPFKNLAVGGVVTLYAQWGYDGCIVTYMSEKDGTVLKRDEIGGDKKTTATGFTPAKKKGYSITGWKDSAGNPFDFSRDITSSITLYADWTPVVYTINFDKNRPDNVVYANSMAKTYETSYWRGDYNERADKYATYSNTGSVTLASCEGFPVTGFYRTTGTDGKLYDLNLIGWATLKSSITPDYDKDHLTVKIDDLVTLANPGDDNKIILYAVWESSESKALTGIAQGIKLIINDDSFEVEASVNKDFSLIPESLGYIYWSDSVVSGYETALDCINKLYCRNKNTKDESYYLDGFYAEPSCETKLLGADLKLDFDPNNTKGYVGFKNGEKVWIKRATAPIPVYAKWVQK